MDWLQFFSSIVDALAWPTAVVILVYFLRKPVTELVPLLQKMKYKDFEMEFGRKLAEAREEMALERPSESEDTISPQEERIIELARVSPRAAVTEAWRWVELATLEAARNLLGNEFKNKTATFQAIRKLERDDRMDAGAVALMRELRGLRNDAVHSPEFALSIESALEYVETARQLVGYLKTIGASNTALQPTR
jgi:hypothetical protein